MRTVLEIYFGINIFITGAFANHEFSWSRCTNDTIKAVGFLCLRLPLAIPYYFILFVYSLLSIFIVWALKKIDKTETLLFWLNFYLTPAYYKMNVEALEHINKYTLPKHLSDSKLDKHWRSAIKAINKRNNYTYVPQKEH